MKALTRKWPALLQDLDDVVLEPHPAADGIVVDQDPDLLRNAADIERSVEFRPGRRRGLLNRVGLNCWHSSPLKNYPRRAILESIGFLLRESGDGDG
jgi:hypothetical protein